MPHPLHPDLLLHRRVWAVVLSIQAEPDLYDDGDHGFLHRDQADLQNETDGLACVSSRCMTCSPLRWAMTLFGLYINRYWSWNFTAISEDLAFLVRMIIIGLFSGWLCYFQG